MSAKKKPLRRCVGCGQMKLKAELVRIVRNQEGDCRIDHQGKSSGRGAYVCAQTACVAKAHKQKGFERSFKASFTKEVYTQLLQEVDVDDA